MPTSPASRPPGIFHRAPASQFVSTSRDITVFNREGTFHAIHDMCPHADGPLGQIVLDGDNTICPWHGWAFCVKNGELLSSPEVCVDCFPGKVEGEDILAEL